MFGSLMLIFASAQLVDSRREGEGWIFDANVQVVCLVAS